MKRLLQSSFLIVVVTFLAVLTTPAAASEPTSQGETVEERWEFYPAKVDDRPASIFLDLGLAEHAPLAAEDTLYKVEIRMLSTGDHGMGDQEEAEVLWAMEDSVEEGAGPLGLRFVGRLRNAGFWQTIFMGPPGQKSALKSLAGQLLKPTGRTFEILSKEDKEWSYYRDFLYPSEERFQWIQNAKVVESLQQHGDSLQARRRVDHFVYFEDQINRAKFSDAAGKAGFSIVPPDVVSGDDAIGLQVHRVDSVKLEHIHSVAMVLFDLAREHRGNYDGWETSVEK